MYTMATHTHKTLFEQYVAGRKALILIRFILLFPPLLNFILTVRIVSELHLCVLCKFSNIKL